MKTKKPLKMLLLKRANYVEGTRMGLWVPGSSRSRVKNFFTLKGLTNLIQGVVPGLANMVIITRERPLNGFAVITALTAKPLCNGNGRYEFLNNGKWLLDFLSTVT